MNRTFTKYEDIFGTVCGSLLVTVPPIVSDGSLPWWCGTLAAFVIMVLAAGVDMMLRPDEKK